MCIHVHETGLGPNAAELMVTAPWPEIHQSAGRDLASPSLSLFSALFMCKHFIGLCCWRELLHPLLLLNVLWYFLIHQIICFVVIFVTPCTRTCKRFFSITHFTVWGDWFLMCFSLVSLYVDGSPRIHNFIIKMYLKWWDDNVCEVNQIKSYFYLWSSGGKTY